MPSVESYVDAVRAQSTDQSIFLEIQRDFIKLRNTHAQEPSVVYLYSAKRTILCARIDRLDAFNKKPDIVFCADFTMSENIEKKLNPSLKIKDTPNPPQKVEDTPKCKVIQCNVSDDIFDVMLDLYESIALHDKPVNFISVVCKNMNYGIVLGLLITIGLDKVHFDCALKSVTEKHPAFSPSLQQLAVLYQLSQSSHKYQ